MNPDTAEPSIKVLPYDASRFLTNENAICEYLNEVLQHDDPQLLLLALGDIAKARGINQMARAAGVERENLYTSPAQEAAPRYDTVFKLLRATGLRLAVHPLAQ